ncbi:MAG: endonuclease/exonuclease/phosphatase family protein [Cyanobacteria bacterium J06553_1]
MDSTGGSIGSTHDLGSSIGPGIFSIDFCNIRGLSSNLPSVEHHLAISSPDLLLLSETQLSKAASPDLYLISNYNLHHNFRFKGGVCAYCNTNTPIARLVDLESSNFDAIWLKITLPTITILLCFLYFSPNSSNYLELFDYLTTCHETLLSSHPHAEILYAGDFNVHHTEWLGSTVSDAGGVEDYSFSLLIFNK